MKLSTRRPFLPFLYFHAPDARPPARPGARPSPGRGRGRALWPYPSRAMLGVLMLFGLCVALACWSARLGVCGPAETTGFDLRAAVPSPTVNITSAEVAPLPPAPAPQPEPDKQKVEPPLPPEPVPADAAVTLRGLTPPARQDVTPPPLRGLTPPARQAEVELPPLVVEEKVLVPVVFYGPGSLACSCFHELQRGDTPMLRNWNTLKLSSLLALAVAATPAPAPAAGPDGQTDAEKLERRLKSIETFLDSINNSLLKAFTKLDADIAQIKNDVKNLKDASGDMQLQQQTALKRIGDLEAQMGQMKADMDKLRSKLPNDTISLYPPAGWDEVKAKLAAIELALAKLQPVRIANSAPTVGRILLVNAYPEEMLFIINSRPYRVAANTTVPLENQPPGTFNYEVISPTYGPRANRAAVLGPNETYTITVR